MCVCAPVIDDSSISDICQRLGYEGVALCHVLSGMQLAFDGTCVM